MKTKFKVIAINESTIESCQEAIEEGLNKLSGDGFDIYRLCLPNLENLINTRPEYIITYKALLIGVKRESEKSDIKPIDAEMINSIY